MKKSSEEVLLNTNKNSYHKKEFNEDLINNVNNQENNPINGKISFSSKEVKSYYHKIKDSKAKKYNNKNMNDLSNLVYNLINKNNYIEEKIQKNINDNILFNENDENDLMIKTLNRRKNNKKINFNENILTKKYSSTINIFSKKKINELNKTINGKKNNIPFPRTTKNKKQIFEKKNNYLNNRNYNNRTYINKMSKIINSKYKEINNLNNIKQKKVIDRYSNSLIDKTIKGKIKNFINFNKDENQNFSFNNIFEANETKEKRIIKINNMNKYIQARNIRNKNKGNSIFTFERISKLKKSLIQNGPKVFIDKFINEDGTKDDIEYKINKRKYLSPNLNSKKNKIHYLPLSKNKINKDEKDDYFSRIESNINFSKTILNNIKLDI